MDSRSLVQLLALLVVGSVLFYQYEIDLHSVTTWETSAPPPKPTRALFRPPAPAAKASREQELHGAVGSNGGFPDDLAQISVSRDEGAEIPRQPIYEQEFDEDENRPILSQGQEAVPQLPIIELPKDTYIILDVNLPHEMNRCDHSTVNLVSSTPLTYEEKLYVMNEIEVVLTCSCNNDKFPNAWHRSLPVTPLANGGDGRILRAIFYPDDSTDLCKVEVVTSSVSIELRGKLERDYPVGEIPPSRPYCWTCRGNIYLPAPLAAQFLLKNEKGQYLFNAPDVQLQRDETLTLWIVPHPRTVQQYPYHVKHLLFHAFMKNQHVIQNVQVGYQYDAEHGGYPLHITGRDAGRYDLNVFLYWIHPYSEVRTDDPVPLLVSGHMDHEVSPCDSDRSAISDSQWIKIHVETEDSPYISPAKHRHCTSAMEEGRWMNVIPLDTPCRPPFCTGDREAAMINTMSWQGERNEWIWVPYKCHYHFYTPDDFAYCAAQKKIQWIHVMGDSLAREIVAYLMTFTGELDTSKFHQADTMLNSTGVRVTFQAWQDILNDEFEEDQPGLRKREFLEQMLDHFNLRKEKTSSRLRVYHLDLDLKAEKGTPDVVVLNAANAYALYLQSEAQFEQFVQDLAQWGGSSFMKGRKPDGKKVEWMWYGNPFLHGTAHDGSDHITQARSARFNEIAKSILEPKGVRYFDTNHISQSRPEESWDGLHYIRGYEQWNGHVAATYVQVWLNTLLGDCTGAT